MCGIAGFCGAFNPESLAAMSRTISHRGPDDDGSYLDPSGLVGMVHRRLSIIDLSAAGKQPMWDSSRRVAIVFNGEIYNYKELRAELIVAGFNFRSSTDTEVLLNLYLKYGADFLPRLNGIFAFALWDSERRETLVVRDGMGVKPLYYTSIPQGFAYASELKALMQLKEMSRTLDVIALQQYLSFQYTPGERTPFTAVRKLGPGEAVIVEPSGVIRRRWRFYKLPYDQPLQQRSGEETALEVSRTLKQAVRRQMVADVPVGSFLSGGLDSSAIVAFASQSVENRNLQCFTIESLSGRDPAEGFVDDLPFARRVAKHLSVPLNIVSAAPSMAQSLEHMLYHLDEPQPDPAAMNVYNICRLARERGIKVLLSGAGGDDILSGYRRHLALATEKWWSWLPAPIRQMGSYASEILPATNPTCRRLRRLLQYAGGSADRRLAGYFIWLAREHIDGLFAAEHRQQLLKADPLDPLLSALQELPPGTPRLNQMLYLDSRFYLADHNLNYTDKLSMATGVEVRVPFLDPDMVRLAANLPLAHKQRGSVGKWALKQAMLPYLPRDIIYRPKTGFGAPLRSWMQNELRSYVDDILSPDTIKRRGVFDPQAVSRLVRLDREGKIDACYPIFGLICMEIWFRRFLD